jgi:hypothetical protein
MQRSVCSKALIGNESRIISPARLHSFAGRGFSSLPRLSSLSSLSSHISAPGFQCYRAASGCVAGIGWSKGEGQYSSPGLRPAVDESAGYNCAALNGVPWRCALAGIEKMARGVTVRLSIVTVCFLNRTSTPAPQEAMKKQDGQIN